MWFLQRQSDASPATAPRTMRSTPILCAPPLACGRCWVAQTGAAWRDVPAHFGPWATVHSRYHRWCNAGIWQQILKALCQEDPPDVQ
jgi:transposase